MTSSIPIYLILVYIVLDILWGMLLSVIFYLLKNQGMEVVTPPNYVDRLTRIYSIGNHLLRRRA